MIYVDSCIPMYLTGADHPNKRRIMDLVPGLLSAHEKLVTSAETFQEVIHRYKAIRNLRYMQIAYEALEELVSSVEPIHKKDTDLARTLASQYPNLSSRDCLHGAVMKRIQCDRIWTYDQGFKEISSFMCIE